MLNAKDIEPITKSDCEERIKKAAAKLAENGYSCLVVAGPSNFYYFCGAKGGYSDRLYALVIKCDGTYFYICPSFEERRMRETYGEDAEVLPWQEDQNPCEMIAQKLSDFKGKIGLEDTLPLWYYSEFEKASKQGAGDAGMIVRLCRAVKSEKELKIMAHANAVIGEAVSAAFERAKEGMTNREMSELVAGECLARGCKGGGFVLFGEAASYPHGTKYPQKLKAGDLMLCDAGCQIEGYTSDITRSVVFGTPSARQREVYKVLREAQEAARAAAKAGNPLEAPDLAAREVIGKAGFGYDYETFTHRLGHGIGLDGHEWPYLCRGNKMTLKENMTFSDEPGIYIPGEIGMRLEDCMYVTKKGGNFLAPQQKSLEEC